MSASAIVLPATPTPSTYHRIVSPTLKVPTDPTESIVVGLLACQRDPLLRSLPTTVVRYSEAPSVPNKDSRKGKKAASNNLPLYEVVLHDTVIFPEGGGQPSDTGIIWNESKTEKWEVFEAKRVGGTATHYVRGGPRSLEPGEKVVVELDDKGFERRYDHMTMHTAQHLICALFEKRLNLKTLSWSLTSYPSPCYVELERAPTLEEIIQIQNEANALVIEGRQVWVEVDDLEPVVQPEKDNDDGERTSRGIPRDYTGGVKRTIVIDGVDRDPCCGTHLPSIASLQVFIFPQTVALSRSTARFYFVSGPRLMAHLASTHSMLTASAAGLGCAPPDVSGRAVQELEGRRKAEKRCTGLEEEVARFIAKELVAELQNTKAVYRHRLDDPLSLALLTSVAQAATSLLISTPSYLVILSSGPSSPSSDSPTVLLMFGTDEKAIQDVGEKLKAAGIKGGGRGRGKGCRWSGKFIGIWKDSVQGNLIRSAIEPCDR